MRRNARAARAVLRGAVAWLCAVVLGVGGCGDDGAGRDDAGTQGASGSAGARDAATGGEPDGGGSGAAGTDGGGSGSGSEPDTDAGLTPGHIETDGGLECADVAAGQLPSELSCTGLYTDLAQKQVAPDVRPFTPAHELWSDGAAKQRWIHLPEGTQIDNSIADDWQFPVGTKLFKEFSIGGRRVETRLFWKTAEDRWLKAAYHWNEDETRATRFAGGEVDVDGDSYYIPSPKECDQCHKGRDDRALGFELISLALPGAAGLTLPQLIDEELLTDSPDPTQFEIGDDGTGNAAPALGWMHVNCGVSCHNGNSAAEGYASDLRLRLAAGEIDGRSSAAFDAVTTTVGVAAQTPRWLGNTLITAGSPEDSLLYVLASTRDPANPKDQMPPIASRQMDPEGLMLIEAWIRSLPAAP
jgi:hypothetical protein